MNALSKIFIALGAFFILAGILYHYFGNLFRWFGNLPGDIRYTHANTKVFIPITSMLIVSAILSLLLHFARKFF